MHQYYLPCWQVFFLIFLAHIVCQRHFCNLVSSLVFSFSGLFVKVLPSTASRMIQSILHEGWDSCYLVFFRVVFSFFWDTLFKIFSSPLVWWCLLPIFHSICKFPFLRPFRFFLDLVVPLLLSCVFFRFSLLVRYIFLCQIPSLYSKCIFLLHLLGFLIVFIIGKPFNVFPCTLVNWSFLAI